MNDYRDLTVISIAAGSVDDFGRWCPGEETQFTLCGCNAPAGISRNRRDDGANTTNQETFYIFTDSWGPDWVISDGGVRYTTQSYQKWPRMFVVETMVEKPR